MTDGAKTNAPLWASDLAHARNPQNFTDFGRGFGGLTPTSFPTSHLRREGGHPFLILKELRS